jgi:hypothetical protein
MCITALLNAYVGLHCEIFYFYISRDIDIREISLSNNDEEKSINLVESRN